MENEFRFAGPTHPSTRAVCPSLWTPCCTIVKTNTTLHRDSRRGYIPEVEMQKNVDCLPKLSPVNSRAPKPGRT